MSQPLEEIQDQIVERLHAGEPLDPAEVIAAHPEHAEALKGFFRVLELVERGSPPPAAPSRLGEFQIVGELGRGGMGVVYEAEQLSLKRRVALKVLPPALGHDARLKARFQREAEAAGKLRHPGIVPVISFGDVAGTPFFAMELVDGRSLSQVLAELREGKDAGVPPAGEARQRWAIGIAIEMAEALAYAHQQGIVHRDVKPGNILIDRAGKARLSDFGLAQDLGMEGLTTSGESLGSPRYMSPEQAFRRKLPVDHRSDIYSLGVTLYEMLTLRYPYEGATSVEYMNELAQGRVVPPRKADSSIPAELESVLLRALAKEPEQRYGDASAFAEDLKAVLEKRAVATETATRVVRRKRKLVRRPLFWVGTAATLLAVGIVGNAWIEREMTRSLGPVSEWKLGGPNGVRMGDINKILDDWNVRVELRKFVSRRDPGTYVCAVGLPPGVGEEQEWQPDISWSVSLDGKNWRSISTDAGASAETVPAIKELSPGLLLLRVALKDVLGDALRADSVTLHHRLGQLRLRHRDGGEIGPTIIRRPNEFTQTIFLYEELPPDYPEAVSGTPLDDQVRELMTPTRARFTGTSSLEGGFKAIRIDLGLVAPGLPVCVAGEFSLFRPGEAMPFAKSRFVRDAEPLGDESRRLMYVELDPVRTRDTVSWNPHLNSTPRPLTFVLEPMPPEKEVQQLLQLEQGTLTTLRVVFEPSRTVARESSSFDRYWDGRIDVQVPFETDPAAEQR